MRTLTPSRGVCSSWTYESSKGFRLCLFFSTSSLLLARAHLLMLFSSCRLTMRTDSLSFRVIESPVHLLSHQRTPWYLEAKRPTLVHILSMRPLPGYSCAIS